jgi:predicted glycogen debranching enzyme
MNTIRFGREITSHLEAALQREWLVTNGIGGYASSTIALANTRRYHGLLVAALEPPRERTLAVAKLETTIRLEGDRFPISTNEYIDGTINPHGYLNLERFELEGTIPVFTWAVADNLLEQRIWMIHHQNTTVVTYTLIRASHPVAVEIIPLCTYREARSLTDVRGWTPEVRAVPDGVRVIAGFDTPPYWLLANSGTFVPGVARHLALRQRAETYRGLEDREDQFAIGRLDARLTEGETLALTLSAERDTIADWQVELERQQERQAALLAQSGLDQEPGFVQRLALAADQFITVAPEQEGATLRRWAIVSSYPWCNDETREPLMALPGLAVATKRFEIARDVLLTAVQSLDQGMLPDRFLTRRTTPESLRFSAADAGLWVFYALHQYLVRTDDRALLEDSYPGLSEALEYLQQGTRFGLEMDPDDGLLRISEAPVGLTWMDARDGNWVATPRTGKPVELNALWHNALGTMAGFAGELGQSEEGARWEALADRVADSFESRYWYSEGGYLFDVVDGPTGDDASLRPNQVLAVSLPFPPLRDLHMARAVVETLGRHLLTSYGLRSLSPKDLAYVPRYGGSPSARASAAHQGTVWSWLMGPFARAHVRVHEEASKARSFLRPFADQMADHGLGSISEMFDGNPPHTPRGCTACAQSVGQILCAWLACEAEDQPAADEG